MFDWRAAMVAARKSRGMNQSALAEMLGYDIRSIQRTESGTVPTERLMDDLCTAFPEIVPAYASHLLGILSNGQSQTQKEPEHKAQALSSPIREMSGTTPTQPKIDQIKPIVNNPTPNVVTSWKELD